MQHEHCVYDSFKFALQAVRGERCYGARLNGLVACPHGSVKRALQDVDCLGGTNFSGLQYELE